MMARKSKEVFRTHANYIRAFALLTRVPAAASKSDLYDSLLARAKNSGCLTAAPKNQIDLSQVQGSIKNAWGTELLMMLGVCLIREEELINLSNNWNVVQTYYIIYHATQSLAAAKGFPRPESHSKTQNLFFSLWGGRSLCMEPWTLAVGSTGPLNFPSNVDVDLDIHSWSTCNDRSSWNLACKALRTTRKDEVISKTRDVRESRRRNNRKAWQAEEDIRRNRGLKPKTQPQFPLPRLLPVEKEKVDKGVRPFSMIDYLYRLRIKTNGSSPFQLSIFPGNACLILRAK